MGQFRKAGVDPKMRVAEFEVTEDALVPAGALSFALSRAGSRHLWLTAPPSLARSLAGTEISAAHFVPGQHVDVQAPSCVPSSLPLSLWPTSSFTSLTLLLARPTPARRIGKGFQGVMKRHGFGGLRASHGVSISHRSHGSTGQHQVRIPSPFPPPSLPPAPADTHRLPTRATRRQQQQDPGRVFPGKKMAGRMGGRNVTTQNLVVERIDTLHNVLYVRGAVPGAPGAFVRVEDALKKVGWKAQMREKRGIGRDEGEVLQGVKGLPMPAASREMARSWPREVQRSGGFK